MGNKTLLLCAVVAVLVIASVVIYLLYTSSTNSSNNAALAQLNSQINVYGANVRYLLNSSVLYSQLLPSPVGYQMLLNLSSPFNSIGAVLNATGTKVQNSAYNNWGAYNPSIRNTVLDNLTELGVISGPMGLENASPLKSVYTLNLASSGILIAAHALSAVFNSGLLSSRNYTGPRSKTIGIAVSTQTLLSDTTGDDILTTVYPGNYSLSTVYIPIGWMILATEINGPLNKIATNQTATLGNSSITLYRFMNILALLQYEGYQFYQMLYNAPIPPSISEIAYTNNVLLVNLGNLNLTNTPNTGLKVDGAPVVYKRYFNWLVANSSLGVGLHNISVAISDTTLYANVYVSPYVGISQYLQSSGVNPSGGFLPARLVVSLNNTAYNALGISRIDGPFALFGPPIINETINTTGLVLSRGSSYSINYTVPRGCSIGQDYSYYLILNTSYGLASYVLHGMCS